MQFQIISDIHLEIGCEDFNWPNSMPVLSPLLILLGDIGYPNQQSYVDYLYYEASRFCSVLFDLLGLIMLLLLLEIMSFIISLPR